MKPIGLAFVYNRLVVAINATRWRCGGAIYEMRNILAHVVEVVAADDDRITAFVLKSASFTQPPPAVTGPAFIPIVAIVAVTYALSLKYFYVDFGKEGTFVIGTKTATVVPIQRIPRFTSR